MCPDLILAVQLYGLFNELFDKFFNVFAEKYSSIYVIKIVNIKLRRRISAGCFDSVPQSDYTFYFSVT